MLTLQRASAGSGKTYTLTKKYIGLLISIPATDGGKRRLRTHDELADSVQHILAVTFTNKATNEMKERIVSRLYDLAYMDEGGKRPDYLLDFMKEYGATEREVSDACREALHQVLYEYSDFNISTIDAFFQNILRTFAYESELPDAYQVVIDESYLSRLASGSLVDDVAQGVADRDERYWVGRLIESAHLKGSSNWNIFQRREGSANSRGTFGALSDMAASLDKQEHAGVRRALDDFDASGLNLRESRERIADQLAARAMDVFAPLVGLARDVIAGYSIHGDPEALIPRGASTLRTLRALAAPDADPLGEYKITLTKSHLAGKIPVAKKREMEYLKALWEEFSQAYSTWREVMESDDMRYWGLIEPALPGVALTASLRRRINAYLVDNDAMKLADTNSMIHRIISNDDVPFIYERLGTRLNHFLIDEFQDTSLMQWENFRPLVEESQSHGHDNLIIGDAKQSIYRFRNAEPRLITEIVPQTFGKHIDLRGFTVDENSNWRSRSRIVKFNNFFFRTLSRRLGPRMASLYANTVQMPRGEADAEPGYVEINYFDPTPEEASEDAAMQDTGEIRKVPEHVIKRVGNLITDLLRRGYRQKEIAVLVNSRQGGKQVIAGLMNYNRTLDEGEEVLEFVSEDSLTLESSSAVNTVIDCFRLLQENVIAGGENSRGESVEQDRRVNWVDIQNSFKFFTARHRDLDLQSRIRKFFKESFDENILETMLTGMQAITLPSLLEAFTEVFVSAGQRELEAPFLAALQDAVLDYCEVNPTDVGSLLRWWDSTGKNISISSPEDTDAINVMTIHKSKGLEFECVILPDIDIKLDLERETLWVDMPDHLSYAGLLSSKLPVRLSRKNVEGTVWEERFLQERYQMQVDNMNKVYVAMTRAVSELYMFIRSPFKEGTDELESRGKDYVRHHSYEICRDADDEIAEMTAGADIETESGTIHLIDDAGMLPGVGEVKEMEEGRGFAYGEPLADVAASLEKNRRKHGRKVETRQVEEYYVNSDRDVLKFHPEGVAPVYDEADDDRVDPRSEGSLKHAVLERVITEDDLHPALERLRSAGLITRRVMREYEPELREALEGVRHRGWFDGSMRVLAERPMLHRGEMMKRPDRVMISPEGDATVVDYKFGDVAKVSAHRRQVAEYMGWLQAMGRYRSVKGYIWYVKKGEVIEVEQPIPFGSSGSKRR